MGFLDRLLGREERQQQPGYGQPGSAYGQQSYQGTGAPVGAAQSGRSEDQQAVDRYRYLLRTAPPERIEEVHTEAFERLTPEQRRMVFDELSRNAPAGDAPRADDPRSLAQAATRSEIRQPGTMERSLGGLGGGMGGGYGGQRQGQGFGSMLGASILGSVAGYVIGSTIMSAFLPDPGSFDGGTDAAGDGGSGDTGSSDTGTDGGASDGGYDSAGWGDGGGFDQDFGGGFDI